MQILPSLLREQFHEVLASVDNLLFFFAGQDSHFCENLVIILRTPHIGNLTCVQDIIQILKESLLDNLSI